MKKYQVTGMFTEWVYADSPEEAIEKFEEITNDYTEEPFDEIECVELRRIHSQKEEPPLCE